MTEAKGPSILIVDDDPTIRPALTSILKARGYVVDAEVTGEAAVESVEREGPDLVILDIGLPGMSGLEACRLIRLISDVPILMLTVREDEADKIEALDLGADDYLTKPFGAGELLARVRALLRRRGAHETPLAVQVGDLDVDLAGGRLTRAGMEVHLTKTEWAILAHLAEHQGRIVQTQTLIRLVWGSDAYVGRDLLRVHMSNLRHKIEPDPSLPTYVLTEPGVGYRLSA